MAVAQLSDMDLDTLQVMYAAVKRAAGAKRYQIENFAQGGKYTSREIAQMRREHKALRQLENLLAANTNLALRNGPRRTGQEAYRGA